MEIKEWIMSWFEKNADLSREEIEKNLSSNYLSKGWIDSFKFISFISDIEKKFEISFSNDEFQNRMFATIDGLTEIIAKKITALEANK